MADYLAHHRAFCEELGRLHSLEVSWDGNGALPLKRKALVAALELFGRRPDLTVGSKIRLHRGGAEISLFRTGRDVQISLCKDGCVLVSGHRSALAADVMTSDLGVTEPLLERLRDAIPDRASVPALSRRRETDVVLASPFDDFVLLRLREGSKSDRKSLLIGRRSLVDDLYAYHEAQELPEDVYVDQPLTGQVGLRDLVSAYLRERCDRYSPA